MEPKLVRKDINYQKKTLIIVSVLVISLFIGGSFALLSSSSETEEVVTFKTGNLNMEVAVTGTLSLEGELPKSYDDGFKNNDITITLTNIGSLEIGKYEVKLEGDTGTTLDANYIRYSVSEDEGKTYLASKLLSDTNNIIYTGYSLKDIKTLKVKLWIDEKAGEAALKKSYNGKINVELYQNDDTLVDVVKSKLVSNYSGSNESFSGGLVAVNTNGDLYHEGNSETIREYRYSGPSSNNYVTFNEEMWRIVGVFLDETGEHIKIVKNESLNKIFPETYTINGETYNIRGVNDAGAYWNYKVNGTSNNDWATAGLQYWLNAGSEKETKQPSDGYMSYLSSDAKNMIVNMKHYLGSITFNTAANDIPNEAYKYERAVEGCEGGEGPTTNNNGNSVEANERCRVYAGNKSTWEGKISLLYPSDYGFSANSSYWDTALTYISTSITCLPFSSGYLLSPNTYSYNSVAEVTSTALSYRGVDWNGDLIFPALYLKNEVKITGGTGEKNNPYKLILE